MPKVHLIDNGGNTQPLALENRDSNRHRFLTNNKSTLKTYFMKQLRATLCSAAQRHNGQPFMADVVRWAISWIVDQMMISSGIVKIFSHLLPVYYSMMMLSHLLMNVMLSIVHHQDMMMMKYTTVVIIVVVVQNRKILFCNYIVIDRTWRN